MGRAYALPIILFLIVMGTVTVIVKVNVIQEARSIADNIDKTSSLRSKNIAFLARISQTEYRYHIERSFSQKYSSILKQFSSAGLIEIMDPPNGSKLLVRETTVITIYVDPAAGQSPPDADKIELWINNTLRKTWDYDPSTEFYRYYWDPSHEGDAGWVTVEVKLISYWGDLIEKDTKKYFVDAFAPEVRILSPEKDVVGVPITITVEWSDDFPYVCRLYINEQLKEEWTTAGKCSYYWGSPSEGIYEIKVEAVDQNRYRTIVTKTITVDRTPPTLSINQPTNGGYLRGTVLINVTWNDEHPDRCEVIACHAYEPVEYRHIWTDAGRCLCLWDTTTIDQYGYPVYPDGEYVITVIAYDEAGNSKNVSIVVFVDNTKPQVSISIAGDRIFAGDTEYVVAGFIFISVSWSDMYPDNCSLFINGELVNSTRDGLLTYLWDTNNISYGIFNITAVAFDSAGNKNSTIILIVVDNKEPQISSFVIDGFNATSIIFDSNIYYVVCPLGFIFNISFVIDDPYFVANASYTLFNSTVLRNLSGITFSSGKTIFVINASKVGFATLSVYLVDIVGNMLNKTLNVVFYVFDPRYTTIFSMRGEFGEGHNESVGYYNNLSQTIDIVVSWDNGTGFYPLWGVELFIDNTSTIVFGQKDYSVKGHGSVVAVLESNWFLYYRETKAISGRYNLSELNISMAGEYELYAKVYYTPNKHSTWSQTVLIRYDDAPPDVDIYFGGIYYVYSQLYVVSMNSTILNIAGKDNMEHYYRVEIYVAWSNAKYWILDDDKVQLNICVSLDFAGHTDFWNRNITLHINITDLCGNTYYTELIIYIDAKKPTISIEGIENNTVTSINNITFVWNVSDDYLANVTVIVEGAFLSQTYTNSSGTVTLINLRDGIYEIVIVAVDMAGNTGTQRIVFEVDTTPPVALFLEPAENTTWIIANRHINISFYVWDQNLYAVVLEINGSQTYYYEGSNSTIRFSEMRCFREDGTYILALWAQDKAGNTVEVIYLVYVDSVAPQIIIYSPEHNATYGANVTINITILDEYLAEYKVFLDGKELGNLTFNATLDTGFHTLYVYAMDKSGNIGEASVVFYVDADPPQPVLFFDNITNETILNWEPENITVSLNESCYICIYIDGRLVYRKNITEPMNITINSIMANTTLCEGEHEIVIEVVDNYGNVATWVYHVIIDKTPPKLSVSGIRRKIAPNATIEIKVFERYLENITVYIDDDVYAVLDGNETLELALSEGTHTIRIIAYDIAGNTAELKYTINVVIDEHEEKEEDEYTESVQPYPEEADIEVPLIEEKEEPLVELNDPLAWFSAILIAISLVAMIVAIIIKNKSKRLTGLLLAVAIAFGIHMFLTWSIVAKEDTRSGKRALAEAVKANGTLTILSSEGEIIKAGSAPGLISSLRLGSDEEYPTDPSLLHPLSYRAKTHIDRSGLVVWSPGIRVSNDSAAKYILDILYQFASTTFGYSTFLFGAYATARNLVYALIRAEYVIILTHSTQTGILTKDVGGFLLNATVLEALISEAEKVYGSIRARVIAIYCDAPTHPITKTLEKYTEVIPASRTETGLDVLNSLIELLFGGYWALEWKREVRSVLLDGERFLVVYELNDTLADLCLPLGSNQSITIRKVERKERIYLVDPMRNITEEINNYGTVADKVEFVETLKDEHKTRYVYIPGPLRWIHKPLAFGRVKVLGDIIYHVDFGQDVARIIGWLQENLDDARRYFEMITRDGNHTISEIKSAMSFFETAKRKIDALFMCRDNAEGDDRREVNYIIRNAMWIIMRYKIWIARTLRAEVYLDIAEDVVDEINFILRDKMDILGAVERLKKGLYNDPAQLARDIKLLGLGFRISIKALQLSVKARIISSMIPGIKRYLTNYIAQLGELAELRYSFGLMIKARFLQNSLGALNLVNLIVESLRDSWNETLDLFDRLSTGDYNISANVSKIVEEDIRKAEEILGTLRMLYTLTFRVAVLKGFYPIYSGLYDEAKEYSTYYFKFMKVMRDARNVLRVAKIVESLLLNSEKYSEMLSSINTTKLMELYQKLNITFVETESDHTEPPVLISCNPNCSTIIKELRNCSRPMARQLSICINTYNDFIALKYALRLFQGYLIAQRAMNIVIDSSLLGSLTEFISTADDLISLAEIQIELAKEHQHGIWVVNKTKQTIDELQNYDTYNITEAMQMIENLTDQTLLLLREIVRIQGKMLFLSDRIMPLIYAPNYGYGEIIKTQATATKRYLAQLANWYYLQYKRLGTLLRAALVYNTYVNVVVPKFDAIWLYATVPENLTLRDVEYWIEFAENLTAEMVGIFNDVNNILTEARGEQYESDVLSYLSWRDKLYEMITITNWIYNTYIKARSLIEHLLEANTTIQEALFVQKETLEYILNTTALIESGEYDGFAWEDNINISWNGDYWEKRFIEATSPLIQQLLIIESLYAQIYDSKCVTNLARNETAEGCKSLYYMLNVTIVLNATSILVALGSYLSIAFNFTEPVLEPKYSEVVSNLLKDIKHADLISNAIDATLYSALYHRLEEILYGEVKSIISEEPSYWDIEIIEYAYQKLNKIIALHGNLKIESESLFISRIAEHHTEIHELGENLARSNIVSIVHRLVSAWEKISIVEEEVSEDGGIVYYRAVYDEETGWRLAVIYPHRKIAERENSLSVIETTKVLLSKSYDELLNESPDVVEFIDPASIEDILDRLEYLVMLYEQSEITQETTGIAEIDSILNKHYEAMDAKRKSLAIWYDYTKETLSHKGDLIRDIQLEDPSAIEIGAKNVLGGFAFVDELVNSIAKGASDFIKYLKARLDEVFGWVPWPFHDPLVNAILSVVAAPIMQLIGILRSDVGKMILSGVYMAIQMGADIIQIVAVGLAWLIMKAIEFLAWLLGNLVDVIITLLNVPEPVRSIIRDLLCGALPEVCEWAGEQAMYMEHIIAERLRHLIETTALFLGPIFGVVSMTYDAVRSELGQFLLNVYELHFELYADVYAPAVMRWYGYDPNETNVWWFIAERIFNGDEPLLNFIRNIGVAGYKILPDSECIAFFLKHYEDYVHGLMLFYIAHMPIELFVDLYSITDGEILSFLKNIDDEFVEDLEYLSTVSQTCHWNGYENATVGNDTITEYHIGSPYSQHIWYPDILSGTIRTREVSDKSGNLSFRSSDKEVKIKVEKYLKRQTRLSFTKPIAYALSIFGPADIQHVFSSFQMPYVFDIGKGDKPRSFEDSLESFLECIVKMQKKKYDGWITFVEPQIEWLCAKLGMGRENFEAILDGIISSYISKLFFGVVWNRDWNSVEALIDSLNVDLELKNNVKERLKSLWDSGYELIVKRILVTILQFQELSALNTVEKQLEFFSDLISAGEIIELGEKSSIDEYVRQKYVELVLLLAHTNVIEGRRGQVFGIRKTMGAKKVSMTEIYKPILTIPVATKEGIKYIVEICYTQQGITIIYRNVPRHQAILLTRRLKMGGKSVTFFLPVVLVGDLEFFTTSQDVKNVDVEVQLLFGDGRIVGLKKLLPDMNSGIIEVKRGADKEIHVRVIGFFEYYRQDYTVSSATRKDIEILRKLGWIKCDDNTIDVVEAIMNAINRGPLDTNSRAALAVLILLARQIQMLAEQIDGSEDEKLNKAYEIIKAAYAEALNNFKEDLLRAYYRYLGLEVRDVILREMLKKQKDKTLIEKIKEILVDFKNEVENSALEDDVRERLKQLASSALEYVDSLYDDPAKFHENFAGLCVCLREIFNKVFNDEEINTAFSAELNEKFRKIYQNFKRVISRASSRLPPLFNFMSQPIIEEYEKRKSVFLVASKALMHSLHIALKNAYAVLDGVYAWHHDRAEKKYMIMYTVINKLPKALRYMLALEALEYLCAINSEIGDKIRRQKNVIKKLLLEVYEGNIARRISPKKISGVPEDISPVVASLVAIVDRNAIVTGKIDLTDMSPYKEFLKYYIRKILASNRMTPRETRTPEIMAIYAKVMTYFGVEGIVGELVALLVSAIVLYTQNVGCQQNILPPTPSQILDKIANSVDPMQTITELIAELYRQIQHISESEVKSKRRIARELYWRIFELRARLNVLKKMSLDPQKIRSIARELKEISDKAKSLTTKCEKSSIVKSIAELNSNVGNSHIEFAYIGGKIVARPTLRHIYRLTDVLSILSLDYEVIKETHAIPLRFTIVYIVDKGKMRPIIVTVYDMLSALGGFTEEKCIDMLIGVAKMKGENFEQAFDALLERILEKLGIDERSAVAEIFRRVLLMYIEDVRRKIVAGASIDEIKSAFLERMKILEAIFGSGNRRKILLRLVDPKSKEDFEKAKLEFVRVLVGENLIGQEMFLLGDSGKYTEDTCQEGKSEQTSTQENKIAENMEQTAARNIIEQKFREAAKKIFSKASMVGFARGLLRQLLTGLFVVVFAMIGMKFAELAIEMLCNKEQLLLFIGLDGRNRELGRIALGTRNGMTKITLIVGNKKREWVVEAENSKDAMREALSMLNSTGQLKDIIVTKNSPIALIPHFRMKTLIWLIITFLVGLMFKMIITNKILGVGKKIAVVVASTLGVWAYAKDHKLGLMDDMPLGIPMMAWLWVWDEFDDFQDGIEVLRGGEKEIIQPGETMETWNEEQATFLGEIKHMLLDPELTIGALLLGFFGQILGVSDPMQLLIPGLLGFAQYVAETFPPEPWGTIFKIIYDILAFILAQVIASGAKGIGWIFYLAGSVIGNVITRRIIDALEI